MSGRDIGARVRDARQQRGLSLGETARLTKLSTHVLEAIEHNDFARLPAGIYRKAYLRTVAAEVGLDPREISAVYATQYEAAAEWTPKVTETDRWVAELQPSPRPTLVALTALLIVWLAWFSFVGS